MTRLLIAEDDINLGALLAENLRMAGYSTALATDGHEAKQLFAQQTFDLCVLDVMLPKKDGFQLALEIREKDPSAAFIFLTAKNTMVDKMAGFKVGCDDYMTKPFEMDELLLRINAKPDGRLLRTSRDNRAHLDAYLEDYAYLAEGLLDLYEAGAALVARVEHRSCQGHGALAHRRIQVGGTQDVGHGSIDR